MPIIKSAVKRVRQANKNRQKNQIIKQQIKIATKAFAAKPTSQTLSTVQSEYDKAVKKGLIKKNTASRKKAQLAKKAKENGVKFATATKKPVAKKAPVKTPATKKPSIKKTK